jgi:hypothetical protein
MPLMPGASQRLKTFQDDSVPYPPLEQMDCSQDSSVVRGVRMLRGEYVFLELEELREHEQKVLLVAATVLFVENNVCFS